MMPPIFPLLVERVGSSAPVILDVCIVVLAGGWGLLFLGFLGSVTYCGG